MRISDHTRPLSKVLFLGLAGCALTGFIAQSALAQAPARYEDSQGNSIDFDLGPASFADEVVDFQIGKPLPKASARNPENALGAPDHEKNDGNRATTLGCSGSLIVQFTDNVLIDQPGDDLHIFEVGPDVEPTFVAISTNGEEWVDLGLVGGGTASLDIAEAAEPGAVYRYVRLTDDGIKCRGRWPGADIDAIGAISAARLVQIPGNVLFDHDSSELRRQALALLDALLKEVAEEGLTELLIVGHTDSSGSDDYNLDLSLRRARAVEAYVKESPEGGRLAVSIRGAGEREPIAGNDTEAGQALNRRVEFIFR